MFRCSGGAVHGAEWSGAGGWAVVNGDAAVTRRGSGDAMGMWGTSWGRLGWVGGDQGVLVGDDGVVSDAAGDEEGRGCSCGEPRFVFRFPGFSDA